MSEDLAERRCQPCEGGIAPLTIGEGELMLAELHDDWRLSGDGLEISRVFDFSSL